MLRFDPTQPGRTRLDAVRPLPGVSRLFVGVIAVLAGFLTVGVTSAFAEPSARERLERTEARVERLSEHLVGTRQRFDRLERRARSTRQAEVAVEERLVQGEERLERIGRELEAARTAARVAGRKLALARERLAGRMVAIYESGTSDAMAIMLSTRDFGELAAAGSYLEAIANSERDLARRVADLRLERLEALREARRSQQTIEDEVSGLRSARASLAGVRQATEQAASSLSAVERQREAKVDRLRANLEEIEAELASGAGGANFAGGPYAIPTYIVMCESGGNYSALNPSSGAGGAYQIIPSTWEAYGGEGLPHLASKAEQDRIARLIWENDGPGAWVCA